MSIPCIFVYSVYCVYLWGLKVPIVSLLSINSIPVAPGLHRAKRRKGDSEYPKKLLFEG
jgi:hypothetical protein